MSKQAEEAVINTFGICCSILVATKNRDIEFGEPAAVLFCRSEDVFQACFFALREEIQQTTTEELLFRTDSFCTRFLSSTLRHIGGKFLKASLVPMFKEIDASPPIETDVGRLEDPEDLKTNLQNLANLCSTLLNKLLKSIQKINPIIAHILLEVYNQVHDTYPRAASKSLGAILFLRFIFPAFTQPVQHKLISTKSPALSRKLIIVAKIMQCIFNEVVRREDEWLPFAPFILKNIETNKLVYEVLLAAVQASKVSRKHFPVISKHEIPSSFTALSKLCNTHLSVCEELLNDNKMMKEMLMAVHRQALIMNTSVIDKNVILVQANTFITWLQSTPLKGKSMSVPTLSTSRRSSFVERPITHSLLDSICQYLISQQLSAQLFLKYTRSTIHSDALYFLDMAVNDYETLNLGTFSLKVIVQALYKYLTAQPLLEDSVLSVNVNGSDTTEQLVEQFFCSISELSDDKKMVFKVNSLFTLFENLIVCSNDPPTTQLARALSPMIFSHPQTPTEEEQNQLTCVTKALEIILQNIGDVLKNIMPKNIRGAKFTPPSSLDQRDWQFLFINSRTINFDAEEIVLAEGDRNKDLWYIQAGSVHVVKDGSVIATLVTGEFFGDISFISQVPTQCKIIAESRCVIQRISSDSVLRMLECDSNLFERFYFMIAKFTAERLVRKTNHIVDTVKLISMFPVSSPSSDIMPIEIYFSDGTSQWFECDTTKTIKYLRDHINNTIERGQNLSDVAYARLYESCINPISNERQFSILEDTWTAEAIFTRAKYASRHFVYFLLEDPTVTQNEFSLSTAFIINEFNCKYKRCSGTMYIIPRHIVFQGKSVSLSSSKKKYEYFISLSTYKTIRVDGSRLYLTPKEGQQDKFRFFDSGEALLAFQTLRSLHGHLKVTSMARLSSSDSSENLAIVIKDFSATSSEEMSVASCQIVNVLTQSGEYCRVEDAAKARKGKVPQSSLKLLAWKPNSVDTISRLVEYHLASYKNTNDIHLPSSREWLKILAGGKLHVFRPGEVILRRGSKQQRMYQVVEGLCVVRSSGETAEIIAKLGAGEIFGEISLLLGNSTATVITAAKESSTKKTADKEASQQNTIVLAIEAEFLQRLFSNDKILAGKFYKYVAHITQRRLTLRSEARQK